MSTKLELSGMSQWTGTHITFNPLGVLEGRKTNRWDVLNKYGDGLIGQVKWFSRWRKYSFFPEPGTVFEGTCMREISQFIEDRTRDRT